MTDFDLDALAAVAEAATPGEWRAAEQTHGEWYGIQSPHLALGNAFTSTDAAHMVTFDPLTVLALVAEARDAQRLRGEVAALAVSLDRGDSIDRGIAEDLRALVGGGR